MVNKNTGLIWRLFLFLQFFSFLYNYLLKFTVCFYFFLTVLSPVLVVFANWFLLAQCKTTVSLIDIEVNAIRFFGIRSTPKSCLTNYFLQGGIESSTHHFCAIFTHNWKVNRFSFPCFGFWIVCFPETGCQPKLEKPVCPGVLFILKEEMSR